MAKSGPPAPPSSVKIPGWAVGLRPGRVGAACRGCCALSRIEAEGAAVEPVMEYQLRAQLNSTFAATADPNTGTCVATIPQEALTSGRVRAWIEHGLDAPVLLGP